MKLCSTSDQKSKKKESEVIILPKKKPKTEREVIQVINETKKEQTKRTEKIEGKKEIDETEKLELKKRTNLISISDLDELEEIESEKTTEKRDTEFKNEELQEAWREYVNSQKEKGKSNFATTLDMNKPVLLPNCKIEIPISNKSQEVVIEKEKIDLHEFLRNRLQNDNLEVITKIQEKMDEERTPFTNKDKYEKMTKENPKLQNLKEKLGLDFDF